jgi:pimeloyl-ACP methyl ester carboxylesterase
MSDHQTERMRDIDVNGVTLHYATWGSPSDASRAVLLLHGITASHKTWEPLAQMLAAEGRYVLAPDLRGRGLSAKPPHGYGIPYHANDVLSLCDTLGFDALDVVGHSLGALITLFVAALHPDRVRRIVLVDGGGKIPEDAYEVVAASIKRVGTVYPSVDAYLEAQRASRVYQWNPFWEDYYRYDADEQPDGTVISRVRPHVLREEIAVNNVILTENLPPLVRAPTLILRAGFGTLAADRGYILPPAQAELIRDQIAGSRLVVVPDTNHYTITVADTTHRAIAAFLNEDLSM